MFEFLHNWNPLLMAGAKTWYLAVFTAAIAAIWAIINFIHGENGTGRIWVSTALITVYAVTMSTVGIPIFLGTIAGVFGFGLLGLNCLMVGRRSLSRLEGAFCLTACVACTSLMVTVIADDFRRSLEGYDEGGQQAITNANTALWALDFLLIVTVIIIGVVMLARRPGKSYSQLGRPTSHGFAPDKCPNRN